MALLTNLIFNLAYYGVIFGYPGYQVSLVDKENKKQKLWILYFFLLGVFTLLEGTLLFPIRIDMLQIMASFKDFVLFMALSSHLQDQIGGKYIDMAHNISWGAVGKFVGVIGIPNRETISESKKTQ